MSSRSFLYTSSADQQVTERQQRFVAEEAGLLPSWCCICYTHATHHKEVYSPVFRQPHHFALCDSKECKDILRNIMGIQALMFGPAEEECPA